MQESIRRRKASIMSALVAFVCAFSLLGTPDPAFAETANPQSRGETRSPSVAGIDFLQPNAQTLEFLRIDGEPGSVAYVTISMVENGRTIGLLDGYKYEVPEQEGDDVAHILTLPLNEEGSSLESENIETLKSFFQNGAVMLDVKVTDAKQQGETLFEGSVYPVMAELRDGSALVDTVFLGVRSSEGAVPKNLGVGSTYYTFVEGEDGREIQTSYSLASDVDNRFENDRYVVTYYRNNDLGTSQDENNEYTVSGGINYVDENGTIVHTESVSGIGKMGKDVAIEQSFWARIADDKGKETSEYYRTLSNGKQTVKLTRAQPTYTLLALKVTGMTDSAYQVTINYIQDGGSDEANRELVEKGEALWTDTVDVKGEGYQYTLPQTFSMRTVNGKATEVALYTYQGVRGLEGSGVDLDADQAVISFDRNLKQGLIVDESDGASTYSINAVYSSSAVTKEATFTVHAVDGSTGEIIDDTDLSEADKVNVEFPIAPAKEGEAAKTASYKPAEKAANLTIDGQQYVSWTGNPEELTYEWADTAEGKDLVEYVYYVPEDYEVGEGYDIAIQYVNIANNAVLDVVTERIEPGITDYVIHVGDERLYLNGNQYVRLAGQDAGIRHTYFTPHNEYPTPTYTVYYRDVNDTINANTTITRTEIIETTRTEITPATPVGGGLTAAPVAVADGAAGAPAVDTGVAAGDGTVIINDDDNPLANNEGMDTAAERSIEDEDNPLASSAAESSDDDVSILVGAGIGAIALAAALAAFFLLRRRNRKTDQANV